MYDGYMTNNQEMCWAGIKMSTWFLIRRLLTGVNVVFMRHQPIWFQLTFNMYLTLIDVSLKMHWSPYEDKLAGFMEKFNDCLVLILSYFPFVFTDLTPTAEDKYFIGWFYDGIVGAI